jgi:hypothetical protein
MRSESRELQWFARTRPGVSELGETQHPQNKGMLMNAVALDRAYSEFHAFSRIFVQAGV